MAESDGRVVSNFIVQALRAEPLTLYGDGGQTRSFCYVDDLVDGLMRLMNTDGLLFRLGYATLAWRTPGEDPDGKRFAAASVSVLSLVHDADALAESDRAQGR